MKNSPKLWKSLFPRPSVEGHKYDRGVAAIYGAPALTGATRLAASACARIGAGLVNVVSAAERADVYRASLPAHILVRDLEWDDARISARLYGCGGLPAGVKIRFDRPCVLDAEGVLALSGQPVSGVGVLTPHEGEFAKVFPDLEGSREARAAEAAARSGAVIVLKGARSVIAAPDGRLVVNDHASPFLATAGTGDVLAGMIAGLLAQGMPAFEASCAAVWLHGDAALRFGPGLVAEDLVAVLPAAMTAVLGKGR
jgi:ADP-dependent NAD(P)H-hydrate dehydratase / NAD(P)H-hydrate epimerase